MTLSYFSRVAIMATALVQAFGFLLLHEMLDADIWPLTDPSWRLSLYAVVVGVPLVLHLSIGLGTWPLIALSGSALLILLGATGAYAGADLTGRQDDLWLIFRFMLIMLLLVFPLLAFLQTALESRRLQFPYDRLYFHAWNNAIILQLVAVFLGIFWMLLMVWAALFNLLDINFFEELFTERVFVYIASGLVGGYGLILARKHEEAVATVRRIILTLHKALLPLLTIITLVFMVALPFAGLEKLWDTGFATSLLLAVIGLNVFFLSAIHADGDQPAPYTNWFRWIMVPTLLTLPAYAGLAAYALYLRVDQYGWSEQRVLAALICLVLSVYAVGYAVSLLRPRSRPWLPWLGKANITVAVVIMVLSVLVNTPVLDPARITVDNQLARLHQGAIDAENFDYMQLRFKTGRHGRDALAQMTTIEHHPEAEIIRSLAKAAQDTDHWWGWSDTAQQQTGPDNWLEKIRLYGTTVVDPELMHWLESEKDNDWLGRCRTETSNCSLMPVSLAFSDNQTDLQYLLIIGAENSDFYYQEIRVLARSEGRWQRAGHLMNTNTGTLSIDGLGKLLEDQAISVEPPKWKRLRIGEHELIVIETDY